MHLRRQIGISHALTVVLRAVVFPCLPCEDLVARPSDPQVALSSELRVTGTEMHDMPFYLRTFFEYCPVGCAPTWGTGALTTHGREEAVPARAYAAFETPCLRIYLAWPKSDRWRILRAGGGVAP